jgi:hypothetical protein
MKAITACILWVSGVGGSETTVITYGSAVKLVSSTGGNEKFFLRSLDVQWNGRSRDGNIVTTIADETNPAVYWIIEPVPEINRLSGDIVKCDEKFHLRHGVSKKYLYVDVTQKSTVSGQPEVTAIDDPESVFRVECQSGGGIWGGKKENWEKDEEVSLKEEKSGMYLKSSHSGLYTQSNCPRCPIVGEREVVGSSGSNSKDSYWKVEGGVILHVPKPRQAFAESDEDRDEL